MILSFKNNSTMTRSLSYPSVNRCPQVRIAANTNFDRCPSTYSPRLLQTLILTVAFIALSMTAANSGLVNILNCLVGVLPDTFCSEGICAENQ